MRTTRDNQGKTDLKGRKPANRPDKPRRDNEFRKTAEPARRDAPDKPSKQSTLPRSRSSEPARDTTRVGGKFGKTADFHTTPRIRREGPAIKPAPAKVSGWDKKAPATGPSLKETDFLSGRNPVMEALRSGRPISKLYVATGDHQGSIREIIAFAKEKGVPVQLAESARLDAMSLGIRNQGVVAMVSPVAYSSVEEIIAVAREKQEKPCIVLLDQLKDPQNLGAVLRTVDAAGAHGVLIPQRRSCQLSASVAKASAGAIEYVKVAQIGNVARTLEELKKQGFWVVGTDPERGNNYHEVDLTGPVVIVIGDEGEGMARLTKEHCDMLVKIPMRGRVQSLNASVASAVILYEMIRQRGN